MRIQTNSIVTSLIVLSLVSGSIGCRSNGGPWYNPKSYTWQNPFKTTAEDTSMATPYETEVVHSNQKPSKLANPDVTPPAGGYKEDYTKKELVPQYGVGSNTGTNANSNASQVASMGAQPPAYSSDHGYNPSYGTPSYGAAPSYETANNGGLNVAAMPPYERTNLHSEQPLTATIPQPQPNYGYDPHAAQYPPTSPYGASPSPYANPNPPQAPAAPVVANNYSPYSTPIQDTTSFYGNPQPQPQPYGQPASPYHQPQPAYQPVEQPQPAAPANPYGVPTATPYNVDPAAGFTANPSSYQPTSSPYQPTTPPTGF